MRERLVRHRHRQCPAQRLPAVSRLPLDQPVGRDPRAHLGVVPFVGGDADLAGAPVRPQVAGDQLAHHRSLAAVLSLVTGPDIACTTVFDMLCHHCSALDRVDSSTGACG